MYGFELSKERSFKIPNKNIGMIKIDKKILINLKYWFSNYVQTFKHGDEVFQENIALKEKHTMQVCKEILHIGEQLGLNDDELRLSEVIALFHDIGRFEQYARYKTYADHESENHAELSVKILKENKVLNRFDKSIQTLILRTILYHNRFALPEGETNTCLFFSKLLRDADKLDIWRVVTDYYNQNNGKRNDIIELGLSDTAGFSDEVYQDMLNKRIVDVKYLKNLNDFKLLQMGWIFDINFAPTFQCIKTRHYLEMIFQVLPKSEKIEKIFDVAQAYLEKKTITSDEIM
jgi:putative nucleotidyltransferase with HDIG domain